MYNLLIRAGTGFLNAVYSVMKLRPVKNRIVFMSRQSNRPSQDIRMLEAWLRDHGFETVVLCRRMGGGAAGYAEYLFHMFRQMHHMATAKMVILDSYCIAASLLRHREDLLIAQMWHALGSLKKFSMSILDREGGHSSRTAAIMRMHEQYDIIFTSSEAARPAFAEAFGYEEDALTVMSLPRVDLLLDPARDEANREKIRSAYPQIGEGGRKVILYAPTFRKHKDISEEARRLIDAVDHSRYNLIVKLHPLDAAQINADQAAEGVVIDRKFSTMDMLSICDVMITDYSAVTYEAALKEIPMVFYAFDKDDYAAGRDFYLDYNSEMPGPVVTSAEEALQIIDRGSWDMDKVRQFAEKYIEKRSSCTEEMGQYLLGKIKQQRWRKK